jgi:hypothetical protein
MNFGTSFEVLLVLLAYISFRKTFYKFAVFGSIRASSDAFFSSAANGTSTSEYGSTFHVPDTNGAAMASQGRLQSSFVS